MKSKDEEIERRVFEIQKGSRAIVKEVSNDGKTLKIDVLGTMWMAFKEDPSENIKPGDRVIVVAQDGDILRVKKI